MAAQLNMKQQAFITEYLLDFNATQAAIRAGYSPRTACEQGYDLLRRPHVAEALTELSRKQLAKASITAERLIEEYAVLGFSDMRNYIRFDEKGDVYLDWANMPPEATKAIQEITQDVYMDGKGEDARQVKRTKFKLHAKQPSLDSLAERFWPATKRFEGDLTLHTDPFAGHSDEAVHAVMSAIDKYGGEFVERAFEEFLRSKEWKQLTASESAVGMEGKPSAV